MKTAYLYGLWLQLVTFTHAGKDAFKFHVTFLGRDASSLSSDVGYVYGSSDKLKIKSEYTSCTGVDNTKLDDHTWAVVLNQSEECRSLIPNGTVVSKTGMTVSEDNEFQLYVYQKCGTNEGDGYGAIPDEHLGKLYYVITYCPNSGICQFAITSTTRETKVVVEFPPGLYIKSEILCNNTPVQEDKFVVELGQFDTLHFESHEDLSGTFIRADRTVGVIVGARDVMSESIASDLIEQIPPIHNWGDEFTVMSLKPDGIQSEHILKIVARSNSTKVQTSDGHRFIIQNAGQFVELHLKQTVTRVITSEPVLMLLIITLDDRMSMVQVLPEEQCSKDKSYYYCERNNAVINLVSDSETPDVDDCDTVIPDATYSDNDVAVCHPDEKETKIDTKGVVCGYGLCNGTSAVFVSADWKSGNKVCKVSVAAPGDERDNDCDGFIDEDTCDENTHLGTSIPLTTRRNMAYWSVNSLSSIELTIHSPILVVVSLQSSPVPYNSIRFYVQATGINVTVCKSTSCTEDVYISSSNPSTISIDWKDIDDVIVNNASMKTNFNENDTLDALVAVSYYTPNAEIQVGESKEDCGKIYKGDGIADDLGKDFILPLHDDLHEFKIYISTSGNPTSVNLYDHDTDNPLYTLYDIPPNATREILSTNFTADFNGVRIESREGEISVYLAVQEPSNSGYTGGKILPLDILGPNYHLFVDSMLTDMDNDQTVVCKVYAIKWTAKLRGIDKVVKKTDPVEITYTEYQALGEYHLLQADYPVAVFCGGDIEFLQIPPKETLGKRYFIPPISSKARVEIVRTEADTEVTIHGNSESFGGVSDNLDVNKTYNITGTRPIQVHLLIYNDHSEIWSNTVIPPTDQYGIPVLENIHGQHTTTSKTENSVDTNGEQITANAMGSNEPAFGITILTDEQQQHQIVIPSHSLYEDINKACKLDPDVGLDEDDGNCTGVGSILINHESQNTAGDCPIQLPSHVLPSNTSVNTATTNTRTIRIGRWPMSPHTGMTMDDINQLFSVPVSDYTTALPEVPPGDLLPLPGIEPDKGGCISDCVCPCAWKSSTNLSEEKIRERVKALHEKLKLDKHALSKTVRRLSSATDFRTESQAIGIVSIVWSCIMFGVLLIMDINHIRRDLITMYNNLRQACRH